MKGSEVEVHKDYLSFRSYPIQYPPLKDLHCIRPSDIELIFGQYRDFELLLRNGQVIFFPATKKIALQRFVKANNVAVLRGSDAWDLLTEPFLDRSFTDEESHSTIASLGEFGFSPEQVALIRKRVDYLRGINFFRMEWVALGLADVLWGDKCSEEFARWAFTIAQKGYRQAKRYDFCADKRENEREDWLKDRLWNVPSRNDCKNQRSFHKPVPTWKKVLTGEKNPWLAGAKFDHHAFHEHFMAQRRVHKALHDWVLQQYSSPQRTYHDTQHLEQVVSLLYSFYSEVTAAALLAGWFHDVVYVPGASDNEERSASEMELHMRDVDVQTKVVPKAQELILYTKTHAPTAVPEEQMIHDADMGIFGMDHDAYARYAAKIRQEYKAIPEDAFRQGRTEFLEGLLRSAEKRGRFFYKLDPIFENEVESNVRWELGTLQTS